MQEAVKSKFEQTILGNLTPDGKLLDLEDKNIGPEELRLLCDADDLSSDLASGRAAFSQPEPALRGVHRNSQSSKRVHRARFALPQQ